MFVSFFDMFKIGIGPSSSHTLGPMKAAASFVDQLVLRGVIDHVDRIVADAYGSLSLTGKGHFTDLAITLGLAGQAPETVDLDDMPHLLERIEASGQLDLGGSGRLVAFRPSEIVFHSDFLPRHENAMRLTAYAGEEAVYANTYYSIGGGFFVDDGGTCQAQTTATPVPYEFGSAEELLALCAAENLSLPELAWRNERAVRSEQDIRAYAAEVWAVMNDAIERGISVEGDLPGDMHVPRRAGALKRSVETSTPRGALTSMSWLNIFAMAINETNASCGRVVTAPTNGACGTVPAVLAYYNKCVAPLTEDEIVNYFLVCTQIGALYKMNASISGAEVGCQGEVGVACSMAAGGLAYLMGGSAAQICMAAEIGMEHNLGLTCDPVCGQVQVPCIERNAVAAVKALNAANLALTRESDPVVSLDRVVATMFETGKDMNAKYRETSLGGLAIHITPDGRPVLPCG